MEKKLYGITPSGEEVFQFTLENENALVTLLSRGATLDKLIVADKNGVKKDVLLGFDDLEGHMTRSDYQGVAVGPFANRIAGGRLNINGKEYILPPMKRAETCCTAAGFIPRLSGTASLRATTRSFSKGISWTWRAASRAIRT